jgi:GDP-4-dehydro-6-deoxy-D-mannose reductase
MGTRALVTGISGFVGRHLRRELTQAGSVVCGLERPGHGARAEDLAGVVECDLLDGAGLRRAVAAAAPDVVYHLAAAAQIVHAQEDPPATYAVNVLGTAELLDAVRREAPRARVLLVSSGAVYGLAGSAGALREDTPAAPASHYAASKLAAETVAREFARAHGLEVVIARAFNHTGPGQAPDYVCSDFARQAATIALGRAPARMVTGNLESLRDFLDVRDVVRAYRGLIERGAPGEIYNVCSGVGRRAQDIVDEIVRHTGLSITIAADPARLRPGEASRIVGDRTKLEQCTGWTPAIPFERTLRDLYDDWLARLAR